MKKWIPFSISQFEFHDCVLLAPNAATPFYSVQICEHNINNIFCPEGEFMEILAADYGRVDNTVCRNSRYAPDSVEMNPAKICRSDVTDIVATW